MFWSDTLEGPGNVPDVAERGDAEDEEAPLVVAWGERAAEATYHDDPGEERSGQDVRKGKARSKQEEGEKQREIDEPLDVANELQGIY